MRHREQIDAAITALGDMTAQAYAQHLADGGVKVSEWTPEQRARWTEVDDRLRSLTEAWVQADTDPEQEVWTRVLLHLLRQRDAARAQLRAVGEVLSAHGCDCGCDPRYRAECDAECRRCLACRVEAAMRGGGAP